MKRLLKTLYVFVFCFLLGLHSQVWAVPIHDLYLATVPVATQTSEERQRILPQALLQVLIKVSGNKSVGSLAMVAQKMADAADYVEQYRYLESTDKNATLRLRVIFDYRAVNSLLQHAGQSIWGVNRPVLLVWLVQGNADEPQLVAPDTHHDLLNALTHFAALRGVPLLFPILDLYDLSHVQAEAIWQGKVDGVQKASKRYGDQPILMVRVEQSGPQWLGRWQLVMDDEPVTWRTHNIDLQLMLQEGIDQMADTLAKRFAVVNTHEDPEALILLVDDIKDVAHYTKVMHYLRQLTPVTRVEVEEISPQQVRFSLAVKGGMMVLQELLKQQSILRPSNDIALGNTTATEQVLRYHLQS